MFTENETEIFVCTGTNTWFPIFGIFNNLYLASKLFRLITRGIWLVFEFEILHLQELSWDLQQSLLHSAWQQEGISLLILLLQIEENGFPPTTIPNIK